MFLFKLNKGLAKRARIATGEKQKELYLKSYEMYEKSISLDPNQHETFFDYGNSLYRFSRVKVQQQLIREGVSLMVVFYYFSFLKIICFLIFFFLKKVSSCKSLYESN